MEITRKNLENEAMAYNKFLTQEIVDTMSDEILLAHCHPLTRERKVKK